ncbi:MAG TPA: LysE family translocator [Pedococcus sp.]|jgi:threonine/homoserine/homoserine lactone efflux protein|uniref:LysE family translocator n=1 Tax=Pedococcus sp. TaxID=2860345 RepID=UPI002F935FE8
MPSVPTLLAFSAAAAALVLLPGPNLLYIISRGIAQGRRAALASTLGVTAATAVFVALTAFGLTALISSSVVAFSVVKYAGVAYLVHLAVREFRSHGRFRLEQPAPVSSRRAFADAFVVGITNPKVALFFLAFFPQFVHADAGPVATQVLVLGAVFVAIGLTFDSTYALASGAIGGWLARRPRVMSRSHYVSGAVYLALGGAALLTDGSRRA